MTVGGELDELCRFRGCLLGLAIGDAVGATVEFKERGSFPPMNDMVGGGPHRLKPGQWTDDTSMALCLATSLVEQGGFDANDQMDRYCQWRQEGYLSSTGECFDIGNTTSYALDCYQATREAVAGSTDPNTAGNGSIMRLAPVPMFFYPAQALVDRFSAESSRTTHGAPTCVDACRLLGVMTLRALSAVSKEKVLSAGTELQFDTEEISAVAAGTYHAKGEADIRGSGYVVESLEAALWCFAGTESFEAAILKSANLGDDADTTAAICGQVAGAYYGESGIPQRWRELVSMRDEIRELANRLHDVHPRT
jgi:ADP-ribosyl-[dinitrogen reductase] hydrolase